MSTLEYILLLAFIPVLIVALYVYKRDVYKKEPVWELVKAFSAGMLSAVTVLIINALLHLSGVNLESVVFIKAYVGAGFIEECTKFAFLYWLFWRNPNFDERFDGIVYAVFVSMGFAFVENVLYIYDGMDNVRQVAHARAIFAVPAHALFAIAMGYGMGLARFSNRASGWLLTGGLFSAIIIHGTYDFLLMYADFLSDVNESFSAFIMLLFYIFVILMWIAGFKRMKNLIEEDKWRL